MEISLKHAKNRTLLGKSLWILILIIPFMVSGQNSLADDCAVTASGLKDSPFVLQLNERMKDPEYKVLVLGRHGKASAENKFTAAERASSPKKVKLDIKRPLAKKGKKAAKQLSAIMNLLEFRNVGMWGSYAQRVKETASFTINALGDRVLVSEFEQELYYADVPLEMSKRLVSDSGQSIDHAFFWGHGKSTLALFKALTGAEEGFLPTAAVMIVVLKANDWDQVFNGNSHEVEAYAWSPNNSHEVQGGYVPVSSLESMAGLESAYESMGQLESFPGSDLRNATDPDEDDGFEEGEDFLPQRFRIFNIR